MTDIGTWLKYSKDKVYSVRYGPCYLHIASVMNGVEIPYFETEREEALFHCLRLQTREPLETLRPKGTQFHAEFAFIRSCQILAVKISKAISEIYTLGPRITNPKRKNKQEMYWRMVANTRGSP